METEERRLYKQVCEIARKALSYWSYSSDRGAPAILDELRQALSEVEDWRSEHVGNPDSVMAAIRDSFLEGHDKTATDMLLAELIHPVEVQCLGVKRASTLDVVVDLHECLRSTVPLKLVLTDVEMKREEYPHRTVYVNQEPYVARVQREQRLERVESNAVGLHPLPRPVAIDAQAARWQTFLDSLASRVASGAVPVAQRAALLSIWDRAQSRQPAIRRPAVGFSSEGTLEASWSFKDSPHTFTLEIHRDGTCEWFFRDSNTGRISGTADTSERELPAEAIELLATNFAAISGR